MRLRAIHRSRVWCVSRRTRGKPIEVEIWALAAEGFGHLVAAVPPPLAIGTLRLAGGRTIKGFLCEQEAVKAAQDISRFGGWRAYLAGTAVLGGCEDDDQAEGSQRRLVRPRSRGAKQAVSVKVSTLATLL